VTSGDRPAAETVRLATLLVLAGVGGYVDAVSYLGLGRVFTAAMTGNTVLLALAAAAQDWGAVLRSGMALVGYVGGVALGQVVVGRFQARTHWPRAVGAGLAVELVILVTLGTGWYLVGAPPNGWTTHVLIALSALAMGTQSATVRQLNVGAVSTTYLTGMLTSLTAITVEWMRANGRGGGQAGREPQDPLHEETPHGPALPALAWCVYAAGALAGGLVVMTAIAVALPLAALVVMIVALIDWHVEA
jgi:uncharacterized membrane protein YoaK (UPF0700 family)